jgi:polyhydroxyalkanoate synthesis regulator phasin
MRIAVVVATVLSMVSTPGTTQAQTVAPGQSLQELESQLAILKEIERVVVTERKGIVARTNLGIMVVSNEQFNDHVTLQILTGKLRPEKADSLVQEMVRQSREAFQQAIAPEIIALAAEIRRLRQGLPSTRPVGEGPAGTWYIACTGRYPPRFEGRTYSMNVPSHVNEFWLVVQRGDNGLLTMGGAPLDASGHAMGKTEGLKPFGPEVGYADPGGTMEWTAEVYQVRSPAPNVGGVLHGSGRLSFRGPLGSCEGLWSVP